MPSSKADQTENNADNRAETNQSGGDKILTIDRRQPGSDRRKGTSGDLDVGVVPNSRRKKERRRHIDPTTCERDYSDPELEFMRAMDDYKRKSGRMFPTCSEVLEVVRDLGYVQLNDEQMEVLGLGHSDPNESEQDSESMVSQSDDETDE